MASLNKVMEDFMRRATIAMHHGHFDDALYNIDKALQTLPGVIPQWTSPFLHIRAECLWQMGGHEACLQVMHTLLRVGLPIEIQEEYGKWMARGEFLLDTGSHLAGAYFNLCRAYSRTPKERAKCFVYEGLATCAFVDQRVGIELIKQGYQLDRNILEETGNDLKMKGIQEFRMKNYQRSKQLLQRALIVTPKDIAHSETQRSILSHLATVHFNLKEYQLALDAGEKSFSAKPVSSKDEAERWKERGKTLFKEKKFDLLIKYYSLAIKFAPPGENFVELRSILLSNRSIAYNKTRRYLEALADAKECVRINPSWSKGQYRLGTSLVGLERYREALGPFCRALKVADASDTKDIVIQILSVGEKLHDGISSEPLSLPKKLVQELFQRFADEKEWRKLHLLFMGGAGTPHHKYGEGGLATGLGCDASGVPLEQIVEWGINENVKYLPIFVEELLEHGAAVLGSPGCNESPLQIAERRRNSELLEVLSKYDKTQGKYWKDKGLGAFYSHDYEKAKYFLTTAAKCRLSTEEQVQIYDLLTEVCFITKDYKKSIENAKKFYDVSGASLSKSIAEKWKKRGNDLLGEKKYDIMTECYSLALDYVPDKDTDMKAAILSNRSMAYSNQKMIAKAKHDANLCILNRNRWFRGYSRLASCFIAENHHQEAINQYCRGLLAVQTDEEKFNLANDIVSVTRKKATEIKIPEPIPTNIINKLIKQAVGQKDWETLRFLFLEECCQQQPGSSSKRTLAHDVKKVSFVPLVMILQSEVKDKQRLVVRLLAHGALPNGTPNSKPTPLQLAVEMKDFKLAERLLRYGADPSQILLPGEMFDSLEGSQWKQWLRLARKAKQSKNSKRAEMFYSLVLEYQDLERDSRMQLEVVRSLSELCFASGKYDECLKYGYRCLKLVPTKSEEEAKMWQERGEILLRRGIYSELPNYLTLALSYAPPSNKPLRYKLLCRRSYAYHETEDFQQALEDGSNATVIQPDDVEGYRRLVACYKSLGRDSRTLYSLNQCLRTERNPKEQRQYFEEAMSIAVKLPEGTTALTSEVCTSFIEQIQDEAIKTHDWEMLRVLYLGGGGPDELQVNEGGLATKRVSASRVPIEDVVSANIKNKPETLSTLLDHGALVNGLRGNSNPLVCAVAKGQVEVAKVLLGHGANPCMKTDNNQPLLHNVVQKAIDTGNLEMLRCLLSSKHADIENVQDSKGCSLYHLAMNGKKNNKKTQVIRLLTEANVNPTLKNKSGKRPTECCPKKDDRNKILSRFINCYVPTVKTETEKKTDDANDSNSQQAKVEEEAVEEDQVKVPLPAEPQPQPSSLDETPVQAPSSEPKPPKEKAQYTDKKKEVSRKNLEYLIERLTIVKLDLPHPVNQEDAEVLENEEEIVAVGKGEGQEEGVQEEEGKGEVGGEGEGEDEGLETGGNEEEEIDISDSRSPFENLPWEVDCTENVWKTLQSRRVEEKMRRRIVGKVCMLAQGRRGPTLSKRLEGEPKRKGIHLYEAKLTKGARILWEKAIAFSARCSNDPELRLQLTGEGGSERGGASGGSGRIYSEIIRVWSIVLDHGDLQRQIENVVKSHERGSHCIIKANLKGCKSQKTGSDIYPVYYHERSKKDNPSKKDDTFFPPASSKENEFHILKFYSVTSDVINTLLDGDGKTKIDFPFKVTELEHAIINLKPNPPCPIILLGRSGTGKTTCCLYRLWTEFQNYWESAAKAGPHIPKFIAQGESCEEEEASVTCAKSSSGEENVASKPENVVCVDNSTNEPDHPNHEEDTESGDSSLMDDNAQELYEHFHPLFITKNTVLCSEVQKNFKELSNACPVTKSMTTIFDDRLPNCIQDIGETSWPLFIGARDWLLLLDASIRGKPFFERAKDGSLLKKIEGWGEEDTHLHFIPEDEGEDDDLEDDEGQHVAEGGDTRKAKHQAKDVKRREVTYQVFTDELWPKMNKKLNTSYHPTLVWTEIRSFIKGSVEALGTDCGFLSLQEYQDLGRKRAPTFMGDRNTVYDLFRNYKRICNRQGMFDEADLVYHLNKRLFEDPELSWSIHSVFVDETQDFTQAELSLLIRCCRFQNRMFFTGDTAQSIMRGIAFRFEDLKTLFHGIKELKMMTTTYEAVRIPDRLYQLTHNYRSHAGILRLASSVVNLLSYYFPESFDKLEEDQGLFDGPKPVLLESCSLSDLAMILRGNKRHASRIEFGAHQAVLVVSEEARDNMPEELNHGLVLTIYEAKGLEFDDVLIYNFFKDSHAKKEWRVVTSYIEEQSQKASDTAGLVELQENDLTLKTRPLEFQPEKHKVLNSEFKYLYTAITRARVNVWFFDEDEESRAPMFEYFRRLKLVRAITVENEGEGTAASLTSMFAESSTKEEWQEQGMFFYKKSLWIVAEKCFMFAEDELMIRKCKAQQQAQEALKHRSNPRIMKEKFSLAATQFLECNMAEEAAVCLYNARERLLLAKLYKKMEQFLEASKYFRLVKNYEEASECMEILNDYSQAIEILCEAKLYEKAIEVLERYNSLKSDDMPLMEGLLPPKPNRTIERLCYKLAEIHLEENKREEMERVLQRLPSVDDRISFLKKHECIEGAARALVDNNRREEAAQFLQLHGRFKAAKRYSIDLKFLGDCSLYEARVLCRKHNPAERHVELVQLLEDAIKYYSRCEDKNGEAEALLFLGRQKDDLDLIQNSGKIFDHCHNICGQYEVVDEWLERGLGNLSQFYYRITVRAIERLQDLIVELHKPYTQLNAMKQTQRALCEQFFGLGKVDDTRIRSYRINFCERFHQIAPDELRSQSKNAQVEVNVEVAYRTIARHLISQAINLNRRATAFFKSKLESKPSDTAERPADLPFNEKFETLFNWVYLDSVSAKFYKQLKQLGNSPFLSEAEKVLPKEKEKFLSCKLFTDLLFPEAGLKVQHPIADQIEKIRRHDAVKARLVQYCEQQWKSLETKGGAAITDVFLLVSHVMQLLDKPRDQGINHYLREKEKAFLQASKKNPTNTRLMHEHGMLASKGNQGQFPFEIFLRLWEVGKKELHVKCDIVQSLHETSRRFLTYTAKSHSRFYPSIANTLMILEHQLTVSLIMFARIKSQTRGFCFCIPESYLMRLRLTDDLNCTRRGQFITFEAVEQYARSYPSFQEQQHCLRNIQKLQSHIVNLMFGKISIDFDVFHETFFSESSEQLVVSGVADRTLVLSLTMLANCAKVLYADCEEVILHYIFTVIPQSSFPEHLKTAFQEMNEVSNISDAVKVLKNLLHSRNSEKLLDVHWNYPAMRPNTRASNPDNYNLSFDVNVADLKAKAKAESSRPAASNLSMKEQEKVDLEDDNPIEAELDSKTLAKEIERMDRETRVKAAAAVKIQRIFRQWRNRKGALPKVKQLVEGKAHLDATEDHFSSFKTDSSACTICGENFQETSEKNPDGLEVPNAQANHVASMNHSLTKQRFTEYKNLYASRIEKVLSRVRHLEERNVKGIGLDLDLDQLKEIKKDVWQKIKQIESGRNWQDTKVLIQLLENLEGKVQEIEKLADQVQAKPMTDLTDKDEKDTFEGDDDYDDERVFEALPVTGKQRKSQGQRSRERRNCKKGR